MSTCGLYKFQPNIQAENLFGIRESVNGSAKKIDHIYTYMIIDSCRVNRMKKTNPEEKKRILLLAICSYFDLLGLVFVSLHKQFLL